MPYGCNATWRVTERITDMTDRVVGMASYYPNYNYGDITISDPQSPLDVFPAQTPSSFRLRRWYLRHALPSVGPGPLAVAVRASKLSGAMHFLIEMYSTKYVFLHNGSDQTCFTVRKVEYEDDLDVKRPQTWGPAGGRTVCEIVWSPNAKTAFLRETLTFGYEIVFEEDYGIELPLFCFWLVNLTFRHRKHKRWYGPARAVD